MKTQCMTQRGTGLLQLKNSPKQHFWFQPGEDDEEEKMPKMKDEIDNKVHDSDKLSKKNNGSNQLKFH